MLENNGNNTPQDFLKPNLTCLKCVFCSTNSPKPIHMLSFIMENKKTVKNHVEECGISSFPAILLKTYIKDMQVFSVS